MSNDPLPCPFCGGVLEITKHFSEEMYRGVHRCSLLGAISIDWRETEQRVIDRWNTRHDGSTEPDPEGPHAA